MTKKMLIDAAHPEEVRVALLDHDRVEDFDFESAARKPLRGNIYLARVTRVEPSLQAAFVEYGGNRHGFLAFSEIHPDYYQIPVSDRELLQKAEAEVADLAAQLELAQRGDEEHEDEETHADAETGEDAFEAAAETDDAVTVEEPSDGDNSDQDIRVTEPDEGEKSDKNAEDAAEDEDAASDEEEEEEDVKKEAADAEDNNEKKDEPYDPSSLADAEQPVVEIAADDADDDLTVEDDAALADTESGEGAVEDEDAKEEDNNDKKDLSAAAKARRERDALFERYKDARRKRSQLLRNYKIQEVIKRRQILLVQVVKEERGTKGAALTTYMSLAGRYCVLMPNTARGGGISRKIATAGDRRRLRRVVDSLDVPQGMGLIIRTAGAKRTKTEIKRDYDYLLRLWENIRTLTLKSVAPCLIYEEASLIKRAIRDLYDKDISKVLVEGEAGYREAKDFMKMLMPSHAKYVQPYKDRAPIFLKHNVEAQLDGMYQPTVRLKSGGYIVIHQTEALVAIDVNSGRSTRERNIELTALKTNIEAAHEAARQFRLRDLAGLIVIDFIDMEEPKNNRKVEKALKEALKADRARIQTGRISNFGLLELSRQRRRSGIVDGTTHACPTCLGAGVIRSHEMAALRILRAIEGEAISGKVGKIVAKTSIDVSLYVLNQHRDWLTRIEEENGVTVEILADPEKAGDAYDLEKSGAPRERTNEAPVVRADQKDTIEIDDHIEDTDTQEEEEKEKPKRRRRRRRRKDAAARDENGGGGAEEDSDTEQQAEDGEQKASDEDGDEKPKRRRRRGRRGGRRNRQLSTRDDQQSDADDGEEADGGNDRRKAQPDAVAADSDAAESRATQPVSNGAEPAESDIEEAPQPDEAESAAEASEGAASSGGSRSSREQAEEDFAPKPKKPAKKGWWQRATGG